MEPHEVYEVAVAGNATMTHLALGIDPEPLGVAPFIMATRLQPEVLGSRPGRCACTRGPARWCSPRSARTWAATSRPGCWPPAWTGTQRTRLFIDIGTNCEIVLGNRDWLLATAAPAGPAFEGAAIRCGMRAADGAIEVVTMTPDELAAEGDRRRRARRAVRLRPGRRGRPGWSGSGLLDSSGRFVAEDAGRGARARGWRTG